MLNEHYRELAGTNPDASVTRAEVVQYVAEVAQAERRRIASILADLKGDHFENIIEAIGGDHLEPDDFKWPE